MSIEHLHDTLEDTVLRRSRVPQNAQPSERDSLRHSSDPHAASNTGDVWRWTLRGAYEIGRERFIRYATGCLRRTREMDIYLPVEPFDLVHDAFAVLLQRGPRSSALRRLHSGAWRLDQCIIAAISNRCHALARREQRRSRWMCSMCDDDVAPTPVDPIDADTVAHRILCRSRLRDAVSTLPAMQREVIYETELGSRTIHDLAAELGKAENTLRNHRKRARRRLRRQLMGENSAES
jgi:RNA polymerase sigma factor (sigma-70 family)